MTEQIMAYLSHIKIFMYKFSQNDKNGYFYLTGLLGC
jgi:hypothetical protein